MNIVKNVLSAEDDASDAYLLRLAFETAGRSCTLFHVRDGQEAVDYLGGNNRYSDRASNPLPDLVLLDLNMPRMGGLEVLKWLRGRREFGHLPKVVLSSSADETDKAQAQAFGASAYYVKPPDFSGLVRLVSELESAWLGPCQSPRSIVHVPWP